MSRRKLQTPSGRRISTKMQLRDELLPAGRITNADDCSCQEETQMDEERKVRALFRRIVYAARPHWIELPVNWERNRVRGILENQHGRSFDAELVWSPGTKCHLIVRTHIMGLTHLGAEVKLQRISQSNTVTPGAHAIPSDRDGVIVFAEATHFLVSTGLEILVREAFEDIMLVLCSHAIQVLVDLSNRRFNFPDSGAWDEA